MWKFIDEVKDTGRSFAASAQNAMEDLGPHDTAIRLGAYAYLLDYVLFDSSHGTGKRLTQRAWCLS